MGMLLYRRRTRKKTWLRGDRIYYAVQQLCHGHCLWENKSGQEEKNQDRAGQRAKERCELETQDNRRWEVVGKEVTQRATIHLQSTDTRGVFQLLIPPLRTSSWIVKVKDEPSGMPYGFSQPEVDHWLKYIILILWHRVAISVYFVSKKISSFISATGRHLQIPIVAKWLSASDTGGDLSWMQAGKWFSDHAAGE